MSIPFERYEKAAAFIRERLGKSVSPMPEVCLVLVPAWAGSLER